MCPMFPALEELRKAMNCRNCNSIIDYNYVTNCPQCGCEVEAGDLPKLDPSIDSRTKKRLWTYRFANLWYVLTAAVVAMISGAVVSKWERQFPGLLYWSG